MRMFLAGLLVALALNGEEYLRFSHIQNKIQKNFLNFFSGKIDKEQIDSEISTPLLGKGIPVILGILSTTFFVSGLIWGISSFKF